MSYSSFSSDEMRYGFVESRSAGLVGYGNRSRLLTKYLGGIFADLPPAISASQTVLDLACGPGQWVADVAFQYPHIDVAGIDNCPLMIEYANSLARSQSLLNASFERMEFFEPLPFSSQSFDLIHARLLGYRVERQHWPALLRECWRLLKPGGILALLDTDGLRSNKSACMQLSALYYQTLARGGYGFAPDGGSLGAIPVLEYLMSQAGFCGLHTSAYHLNCSRSAIAWSDAFLDFRVSLQLIFAALRSTAQEQHLDLDHLYQMASIEARMDDYCCSWPFLRIWARKV